MPFIRYFATKQLNMKRIMLLFAVALLFSVIANAVEKRITVDNIIYQVDTDTRTAVILGNNDVSGDIIIPETVKYNDIPCVVVSIVGTGFRNNQNITSVHLPNTITWISAQSFYYCSNLSTINFPEDLEMIGQEAFRGCSNLKIDIVIPDKVTRIDNLAFAYCGMTSFSTLINPVEGGNCAFNNCPNLQEVVYREGAKEIDTSYKECRNLKTLIIPSTVEKITVESITYDYFEDIYCFKSDVPVVTGGYITGNKKYITVHVKNEAIKSQMEQDIDYWSVFTLAVMEEHSLKYYVDGEEYKSYNHYYRDPIIPEPAPQRGKDIFSGWSEIPAYMPDCDYNVYGTFTKYEEVNQIIVDNADVFCGTTENIEIGLQNESTDLTAYQFDLSLPAGFDIAKNKKGKPDVKLSDRYEDDNPSLSIEELGNGKYRFVCISMTNGVIEGTEGPLMSMNIQVPSDVTEGSYTGKVENIVMTHADETKQKLDPVSFTFNVSTYIKGDANSDLEIDVADVVAIVNYILERPSENFDAKAADVDEDGEIDVADAVKVVNMILAQVSNSTPRKQLRTVTQAPTGDGLYVEDFSIKEGEKIQISLKLKNAIDYCSFQCDLFLPEGLTIALNKKDKPDVKLDEDRMDDHSLSVEHAANGSYRLVCTSLSNAKFYENDGPIVNIMVEPIADFPSGSQEGRIENTVLVEANGTKHKDFETSTFKVSFGIPTHVDTVKTNGTYDIYNLQGIKVRSNDSSTVLPKGMYIMNGEKFYVK